MTFSPRIDLVRKDGLWQVEMMSTASLDGGGERDMAVADEGEDLDDPIGDLVRSGHLI